MNWIEIPNTCGLKHPVSDDACPPPTPGHIVDAELDQPEVGRNDPCPCGSGKKFKKCCGRPA